MFTMSGEINIEIDKILLYCRFCLQLQSDDAEEVTLTRKLQQEFFELTQDEVRFNLQNLFHNQLTLYYSCNLLTILKLYANFVVINLKM